MEVERRTTVLVSLSLIRSSLLYYVVMACENLSLVLRKSCAEQFRVLALPRHDDRRSQVSGLKIGKLEPWALLCVGGLLFMAVP